LLVGKLLRDGVDKVFGRNSILRVAAVHGIAGEGGVIAKIFRAGAAELTRAVGMMQPGNPDARAERKPACTLAEFLDHANDLVSRDYRRFPRRELPFNDVQVGPAYAAVRDADQYLPVPWLWRGNVRKHQGVGRNRSGRLEDAGFHGRSPHPHPGCFAKRGCKLLKTNDATAEKREKRLQPPENK
jgi:hypothetical protein